ncbi:MAG: hypothetical protein JHC26_10405 [Thermofilum sp.]|jgi:hypothetical protein|uniref:hypothetical protein n=1 Tax=Thermofilum sp. TaxID=1961369 RepID=UPI002588022B|nr:hypothetical protein [Thermofilum sp.]MCI4409491.1 hypothetical protein [Thermofilum sp.]
MTPQELEEVIREAIKEVNSRYAPATLDILLTAVLKKKLGNDVGVDVVYEGSDDFESERINIPYKISSSVTKLIKSRYTIYIIQGEKTLRYKLICDENVHEYVQFGHAPRVEHFGVENVEIYPDP